MPEPQEQKDSVRVLGPDNKHYVFPKGTSKEQAISYFRKKNILSPESKPPAAVVTPLQPKPGAPPAAGGSLKEEHPFQSGVVTGFGLDPEKVNKYGNLEVLRETTINFGKTIDDVIHDPLNIAKMFDSMAEGLETGVGHVVHGTGLRSAGPFKWSLDKSNPQEMKFGAGMTLSALGQILGGAEGAEKIKSLASHTDGAITAAKEIAQKTGASVDEATRVAHRTTNKAPSRFLKMKAFNDAYIHAKGLDVGKKIGKAADAVHEEVKTHANGIAEKIDTKIPNGTIDAADVAKSIVENFKEEVKAPEKAHPQLTAMIKDATATAPGMWSWEKARQLRSSIGRVLDKVQGPQKVVLTKAYDNLTTKLGSTAKQYGLEKEWNHYNELSRKFERQYADTIDDLRSSQHGHGVAQKLASQKALSVEMVNNLSKYGLDAKEVHNFIRDSQRMMKQSQGMKGTLFRMAYGTPVGVPVMIAGRMAGAGWLGSVAMGAGAGYLSSYLINLARTAKLSPDVIEAIAKSRELPGKMKLGEGNFPTEGGPPQLPAPKPGGMTPEELEKAKKHLTHETPKDRLIRLAEVPERPKLKGEETQKMHPDEKAEIEEKAGRKLTDEEAIIEQRKMQEQQSVEALAKGKVDTTAKETAGLKDHPRTPEVKKAAPGEVGREPGKRPGTTKESEIGRRTKARERVEKARAQAKRAQNTEAEEARQRSQAKGLDTSALQIPEMEEYLKAKRPNELRSLQQLRKKGISDPEYIEGLKYLILEGLEESEPN
jgi:hypothetical protein